MEFKAGNPFRVHDVFHDLFLEEDEEVTNVIIDIVLIRKFLSARIFKRSTIKEIINNMWHIREKVTIEGLANNVFKLKEDKELMFSKRPLKCEWCTLGAKRMVGGCCD